MFSSYLRLQFLRFITEQKYVEWKGGGRVHQVEYALCKVRVALCKVRVRQNYSLEACQPRASKENLCVQERSSLYLLFLLKAEAEFMDKVQTKDVRVFLLAIHSHIYSFALRCLFLQTHATSYQFLDFSYCTV